MKILAYYLPQFYEIEENNRAWGKGFTEWDNVKKAKPLFGGHYQPREPLDDNYYSLLEIDTIKWQAELAKKYGLYGFCFYHYWFRDGKHVLEKPSELLLEHKEIDFPFCFSWANEPWTKTWHGASGEKEVLIEQRYGQREQWREHFDYLLPFFKDSRYITIDEKPVFLIYQINKIGCFNQMMDYWNELCIENGLPGIYIIDMLTVDGKICKNKRVSASVAFEPGKALRRERRNDEGLPVIRTYDDTCKKMLALPHSKNEYRAVFVDYDDSPRRGINGTIFKGSTPEKFGMYLQKTIELSEQEGNDFIFVNAWNEWGESNYLEPDKRNGYAYLEALQMALEKKCSEVEISKIEDEEKEPADKHRLYYELCNQWIKMQNDGYHIETFFREKGYRSIAIYGMGELGNRLIEALDGTDVQIKYGINKNMRDAFAEIDIKGLDEEDEFTDIDCIVVTPFHIYDEIKDELEKKCSCDVISLEDVVYGV